MARLAHRWLLAALILAALLCAHRGAARRRIPPSVKSSSAEMDGHWWQKRQYRRQTLHAVRRFTDYHLYFDSAGQENTPIREILGECSRFQHGNETFNMIEGQISRCVRPEYRVRTVSRSDITMRPRNTNSSTTRQPKKSNVDVTIPSPDLDTIGPGENHRWWWKPIRRQVGDQWEEVEDSSWEPWVGEELPSRHTEDDSQWNFTTSFSLRWIDNNASSTFPVSSIEFQSSSSSLDIALSNTGEVEIVNELDPLVEGKFIFAAVASVSSSQPDTPNIVHPFLVFALVLPDHQPSRELRHYLNVIAPLFPSIRVIIGDAHEFDELVGRFQIRSLPRVLLFRDGLYSGELGDSSSSSAVAGSLTNWSELLPVAVPLYRKPPPSLPRVSYFNCASETLAPICRWIPLNRIPLPYPNMEPFIGLSPHYAGLDLGAFVIALLYILGRLIYKLKKWYL